MRPLTLAVAAGALLVATQANAGSFPVNTMTGAQTGLVDTVAVRVYVHEGRRYCFYFDGWHGPGWYRCGFAWRQGIGWGGVYGWNSWSYGPWERRHHRHGNWQGGHRRGDWHDGRRRGDWDDGHRRGDRIGVDSGSTRSRTGVETRSRNRATTGSGPESNTRMRGDGGTRMRSTTGRGGADVRSGGRMQGGTPSAAPGVRGGTSGGAAAGGGASVGSGGASVGGGGGERR